MANSPRSSIIEHFLKNTIDGKKKIELWHLANFIYNYDQDIEIISSQEEPDFIIRKGPISIGLELTRYFTTDIKHINAVSVIIKKAENIFKSQHPDLKYYINFHLSNDIIEYSKHDSINIANQIVESVYSCINGKKNTSLSFIERITYYPTTQTIFQVLNAYTAGPLLKSNVESLIRNKENNIDKYKINSNTELIWLLIVVSGANSASDYSHLAEDLYHIESKFNNVFILNDFQEEVIRII